MGRGFSYKNGMSKSVCLTASDLPSGLWQNAQGAQLRLTRDGTKITGTYQTRQGRTDPDSPSHVQGQSIGDFVTFSVIWDKEHSLTSWTGRVTRDGDQFNLHTLWILGRTYRDAEHTSPTENWDCLTVNSTDFIYQGPIEE
jgi:hypothetical protein